MIFGKTSDELLQQVYDHEIRTMPVRSVGKDVALCPVCNGRGIVPNGFYLYPGGMGSSTNMMPETCRSCNGKGHLWV